MFRICKSKLMIVMSYSAGHWMTTNEYRVSFGADEMF